MKNCNFSKIKKNTGFIALMSSIIISVILLLIATNLSFTSFFDRSNILDYELKAHSTALAEACVDKALLNLAQGNSFTGIISIQSDTCTILNASSGSIVTSSNYKNYSTKLNIAYDSSLKVISWKEVP